MSCVISIGLACITGVFTASVDANSGMTSAVITQQDGARISIFQSVDTANPLDLASMPAAPGASGVQYWARCSGFRCRYILATAESQSPTIVDVEALPGQDVQQTARAVVLINKGVTGPNLSSLTVMQTDPNPPRLPRERASPPTRP